MRNLPTCIKVCLVLGLAAATAGCLHHDRPEQPAQGTKAVSAPRYAAVALARIGIEGGLVHLGVAQPGIVATALVHPGDHVRRGQALIKLNDEQAKDAVTIAHGRLEQARAEQRLTAIRLANARKRAKLLSDAFAAGAGSGQDASDANSAVGQLEAKLLATKAAVSIARGRLDEARHALALDTLRAPIDGDITSLHAQPGESVSPQTGPLITLLPDTPRIVDAELNRNFVRAVHPGMAAQVVLDTDSEPVVGTAHVVRVGKVYGPSTLIEDPSRRANTRTVRCVLHFDKPTSLLIGERVLVRILAQTDR